MDYASALRNSSKKNQLKLPDSPSKRRPPKTDPKEGKENKRFVAVNSLSAQPNDKDKESCKDSKDKDVHHHKENKDKDKIPSHATNNTSTSNAKVDESSTAKEIIKPNSNSKTRTSPLTQRIFTSLTDFAAAAGIPLSTSNAKAPKDISEDPSNDPKPHSQFAYQSSSKANLNTESPREPLTHPLQHQWTFYFDARSLSRHPNPLPPPNDPSLTAEQNAYLSTLRVIGSFGSIESFWALFHHIAPVSTIELNGNYHVFRSGILPVAESKDNCNGVKITVKFQHRELRPVVDCYWQNLLLAVIGNTLLQDDTEVVGVVFNRRKAGDRLQIWAKSTESIEFKQLQNTILDLLCVDSPPRTLPVEVQYEVHQDYITALTKGK